MKALVSACVRFGDFELDLKTGELRSADDTVRLPEKPFQVLRILLEHESELATREDIQKRLWPNDTVVDFEHGINAAIHTLRRLLGDSADQPKYIETFARRGYRFMLPIEQVQPVENLSSGAISVGSEAAAPQMQLEAASLIGKKVSHYRVLEVIGGGGMGLVYKAEDLKLGRHVALKFLPDELVGDSSTLQRFEREARTASSLNHPNICTIYEVEEHEGQPFIVMELLEGETLRDRLVEPKKPIALDELLDFGIQICTGLQAAHEKGIIHRDIKPANIFLTTSGQVKILDFGLAKLVEAPQENSDRSGVPPSEEPSDEPRDLYTRNSLDEVGVPRLAAENQGRRRGMTHEDVAPEMKANELQPGAPDATLTRFGVAMGTAGYMSPEQVRGEKLDARTDIFSFGLVLYEVATGERAFTGETAAILRNAILSQAPIPIFKLNPSLPAKLDQIVAKALEKDRERRYQSAAQMRADLEQINARPFLSIPSKWKWYTAAGMALVMATAGLLYWRPRTQIKFTPKDTIVVAHVINNTGDPAMDDALDIPLDRELQESPYLPVLSLSKVLNILKQLNVSNTPERYMPQSVGVTPELARQVCLRSDSKAFVTASIDNAGNYYHIVLTTQDCHSGKMLAKVEKESGNRTEIVRTLGEAGHQLRRELGEPEDSLRRFNTPLDNETSGSLDALHAYSQGFRLRAEQTNAAAIPSFKRAIELDRNYAWPYMNLAGMGLADVPEANRYMTMAFNLRERLSPRSRWFMEAQYYNLVTGELEKSKATFTQWLQTFPADIYPHLNFADCLTRVGEHDRAVLEGREAVRLMPNNSMSYGSFISALVDTNRLEEAKAVIQDARARGIDSFDLRSHRYLVAFFEQDSIAMQEQVSWAMAQPETRQWGLQRPGDNAMYHGQFRAARAFYSAMQGYPFASDAGIGNWHVLAYTALAAAETGSPVAARQGAEKALAAAPPPTVNRILALVLARAGAADRADKLVESIAQEAPLDTLVQNYELPVIRAALELGKNQPARALEKLQAARSYEFAIPRDAFGALFPAYLRGLAYLNLGEGSKAAAEFQKVIEHRTILQDSIMGALAHLQLGRAQAMMGDKAAAQKSYQDFLTLWKDADPDIPIYKQAKAEYAKLR